ncbi:MAG: glutathione ABC transporter permease GsiC, partial [Spirochaetaceae bacterium]|nr:glutathione ABC transporter permease GsiC [Spirochaetaceae bacterium]
MGNYIIRRLLLLIPTLLIVTVIVFATVRLIPGDAVDVLMAQTGGGGGATEESRARLQEMLGLDVPVHV